MAIGVGVGVGLVGFCLGGTSRPMRSPFTWNALLIFTLGIIAQQLFAKYYKTRTVRDEMLRDLISGFIFGTANAFIFWG
jgi:glucose uptake protein GlcU